MEKTELDKKHLKEESLSKTKTIGTLYTKNGINYIIANLFLNPEINHLIVLKNSNIDNKTSESIETFLNFLETEDIHFQKKFHYDKEKIHEFCSYFSNHISVISSKDLNEKIGKITNNKVWRDNKIDLEPIEIKTSDTLMSEHQGFMVRANIVKEAWMRSLKLIGTYGTKKRSDYDEEQLELINLSIIVKGEDLKNPSMIGELGITKEELSSYEKTLLQKEKPEDIKYTYGSRFRNFHGIDQLEYMVETLKKTPHSRRAVATL